MDIFINGAWHRAIDDPNICPHCHVVNNPSFHYGDETKDTDNVPTYISVWQCVNARCRKKFVVLHKLTNNKIKFIRFLNGLPQGPDWPKPIAELKSSNGDKDDKSKFIKTYLQSLEAESNGLDELAGMGYRKSIEYLVKDWAIQNNPDKKEQIEKSWLGNDQAHYNRLFEEFDIGILKELIDLIMVELDRQFKKAHYIEMIKSKK